MNTYNYPCHFAFIEAVCKNNYDVILEANNDLNFTQNNPFHWTPLHYSVAYNNKELTKKILEIRDDYLNVQDKYQRTPTSLAARTGNLEILNILLVNGADLSIGLPLCHAATKGDPACVLSLIQYGCNINEFDTTSHTLKYVQRYTPLIIAIKENHPKVVQLLVDHRADVNFGAGRFMTPLHWACRQGRLEMVKALVEKGAELNHRCQHDSAPLDDAMYNYTPDIVRYLLEQGCSLNEFGKLGETPVHTAASMRESIDAVKEMMKYSPNLDIQNIDGATPLYLSCSLSTEINENIFEALIEGGANVAISAFNSWTPLHLCSAAGNLKCVKLILDKSKGVVNAVTMDNITPLFIAASRGHTEICRTLLENGAYINIKVNKFRDLSAFYPAVINDDEIKVGYTAETIALEKENHDIVELLNYYEENHPDSNIERIKIIDYIKESILDETAIKEFDNFNERDALGWTCLHHAAELDNLNLMKICIDIVKEVNLTDKYGRTPLTVAAANGNLDVMKLLEENGANMSSGYPLFYAIENKQLDSVKYLVNVGSNVNVRDRKKRTPIMYAAIKEELPMLEILLQNSFDITLRDEDNETVLHHARDCPGNIVDLLVRTGADVNAQNSCEDTPLFLTVVGDGNLEAMRVLLQNGANPNISDHFQETPLHHAAEYSKLDIVREIMQFSPDVNAKDSDSRTPFIQSLYNTDKRIMELLFEHGADLSINMNGGWTPLHICAYDRDIEFARYLFEHDIDINAVSQESITPIYIASAQGRVDLVRELIMKKSLIYVRVTSLSDWRDLPYFASYSPKLPGSTPLTAAICGGHLEVVKLLTEAGASLETLTEELLDSFKSRFTKSHVAVCEYLMELNQNLSTEEKIKFPKFILRRLRKKIGTRKQL